MSRTDPPSPHSALCDEHGNPLVLLHGTNSPLTRFAAARVGSCHNTPDDEGEMYFFTTDKKAARWYARSAAEGGGKPHVVRVNLLLRNPKVTDFQGAGIENLFEEIDSARRLGHDGLVTLNYDDGVVIDQYVAFSADCIQVLGCEELRQRAPRRERQRG